MNKKRITTETKSRARESLKSNFEKKKNNYVIDTSVIINKFLPSMIKRGLKGRIIIPNAVMAELENQANKGFEVGFIGLEEVTKLHQLAKTFPVKIYFEGIRPKEKHIKYARSGEIDSLIRNIALKFNATLITADLVQAKSAQAYNIKVIFLKSKSQGQEKKGFFRKLFGR